MALLFGGTFTASIENSDIVSSNVNDDQRAMTIYRGDSYPITFLFETPSASLPINLTNCAFTLTVSSERSPVDNTTEVFSVDGVIDDSPSTGKVSFTPLTTDTDILPKKYYYDIQVTDGDGNIKTLVKSTLSIVQDISK